MRERPAPELAPAVIEQAKRGSQAAFAEIVRHYASGCAPTGTEGGNPVSRNVVSLSYRRGLDQVLVTTRSADGGPWSDPLATGEGFVDTPERVVLAGGALNGERADIVLAPRGIPHLWVQTDDLIVTVGGGLGRAQLIQLAESLEAR